MAKQVEDPDAYIICEFDSVNAAHVYTGSFRNLSKANDKIRWREDPELSKAIGFPSKILSLREIAEQLINLYGGRIPMITIFEESPMDGRILQYGNYGDSWWLIGSIDGYA